MLAERMNHRQRIIAKALRAGDPYRRSRFHTQTGKRASLVSFLDLPLCLGHVLAFKLTGFRPVRPWIPYSAARHLARQIKRNWQVLEIGSGMSTLWLAERCAEVNSIEADARWVEALNREIVRRRLTNAHIHFRWQANHMCDFSAWPDSSLDLVFIDGGPRPACFEAALAKVKAGGYIYVDNTDIEKTAQNSRFLVESFATDSGATLRVFRGFVPCNLFVNEGMLLQMPCAAP